MMPYLNSVFSDHEHYHVCFIFYTWIVLRTHNFIINNTVNNIIIIKLDTYLVKFMYS